MSLNYKKINRETYDIISDDWDTKRRYYWKPVVDFLKSFSDKNKLKFLDLGCGGGRHMELALELGFNKKNIFGCDFSKGQVNVVLNKGFQVKICDMENLDFDDLSFDLIVCIAVHHHLLENEKQLLALKEMNRVMSSSGKLLLANWFADDEFVLKQVEKGKFDFLEKKSESKDENLKGPVKVLYDVDGKKSERYYYFFEEKELLDLCEKAGFIISSKEYFKGNIYLVLEKK
ncbi:MAG: class I SAM-dependent methyltransferase [Nanoarchaeota archaeon]|nr:class I SAM-dependent methyltransferase [Nanoarchaeota archaeon]